MSLAPLS